MLGTSQHHACGVPEFAIHGGRDMHNPIFSYAGQHGSILPLQASGMKMCMQLHVLALLTSELELSRLTRTGLDAAPQCLT